MSGHPKSFRRAYVLGVNQNAYLGAAFCGSHEGRERILIGPDMESAYMDALAVLGADFRKDLGREVVVITPEMFQDLLERAHLKSHVVEPDLERKDEAAEPVLKPVPRVGRRRRQIFEKSEGKCHYCSAELELTGAWHVEHMMPKALGGSDDPINLVAACVPCNRKKRDTTDVEFKARLAKESA